MTDSTSNFKHIFCHASTGVFYQESDSWPKFDLESKEQSESKSKEEEINYNKQEEERNTLKDDMRKLYLTVNHIEEEDTEQRDENIENNLRYEIKEQVENNAQEKTEQLIMVNHLDKENEEQTLENNVKNEDAENDLQKVQEDAKISENNSKDQIKDIVEVKTKEMQECLANLVFEEEIGDSADNKENDDSYIVKNVDTNSKPIKGESEEDLNKYNFYQYWHVTPDLELDPQIVNSCGSPNKKNSAEQDFAVSIKIIKI